MQEEIRTAEVLKELQALPLSQKIILTQARLREFYSHYDGQVYISFSGGKDSTVLLDIARKMYLDIPAVFIDTGLEYPETREFVKSKKNVIWLKPKMNFKEVIKTYGYPLISKEVSKKLYYAKKGSKWAQKFVDHSVTDADGKTSRYCVSKKHLSLLNAPFNVSAYCCDIMKKRPSKKYVKQTGKKPILATMADESELRKQAWLKVGCNAFYSNNPHSTPMSFWTEQDVLRYIVDNNIDYAKPYGEIKQDSQGNFYTTGCDRTGCVFCGFGCHLEKEPNRFQRLKKTHPKLWDYCMRPMDKGGLGMQEVLDFIGVKTEPEEDKQLNFDEYMQMEKKNEL